MTLKEDFNISYSTLSVINITSSSLVKEFTPPLRSSVFNLLLNLENNTSSFTLKIHNFIYPIK